MIRELHDLCSSLTTIISPLRPWWLLGGPLFYWTPTTNIIMISPFIFMSASFVCLTCDHCDTYWMYCTSWGSCWWSFSCFSPLESSIQNADGNPKGLCQVNTAVQVVLKSLNQKPNGRAPMLKTKMGCLHFTFTITESHIGWAFMKNGERAIDRINWYRPFS